MGIAEFRARFEKNKHYKEMLIGLSKPHYMVNREMYLEDYYFKVAEHILGGPNKVIKLIRSVLSIAPKSKGVISSKVIKAIVGEPNFDIQIIFVALRPLLREEVIFPFLKTFWSVVFHSDSIPIRVEALQGLRFSPLPSSVFFEIWPELPINFKKVLVKDLATTPSVTKKLLDSKTKEQTRKIIKDYFVDITPLQEYLSLIYVFVDFQYFDKTSIEEQTYILEEAHNRIKPLVKEGTALSFIVENIYRLLTLVTGCMHFFMDDKQSDSPEKFEERFGVSWKDFEERINDYFLNIFVSTLFIYFNMRERMPEFERSLLDKTLSQPDFVGLINKFFRGMMGVSWNLYDEPSDPNCFGIDWKEIRLGVSTDFVSFSESHNNCLLDGADSYNVEVSPNYIPDNVKSEAELLFAKGEKCGCNALTEDQGGNISSPAVDFNTCDLTDESGPFCDIITNDGCRRMREFSVREFREIPRKASFEECFSNISPKILESPEILQEIIDWFSDNGRIGNSLVCKYSLLFRLTGKYRPLNLMRKIKWTSEPKNQNSGDLIYFVKKYSGSQDKYSKLAIFFDAQLPEKMLGSYATASRSFKEFLESKCKTVFKI